jgi:hypothetical protein
MKGKNLSCSAYIFLVLLSAASANAFTLAGNSYTIKGNTGYGGVSSSGSYISNSVLIDQPVGRPSENGYELCLGPLCRRLPPVIGPIRTFLSDVLTSVFHGSETVSIKANVSDFNRRENIQTVVINITDPNSVLRVYNGSMDNASLITKGYTYSYNQYIKASEVGGVWNVKVMATSRHGFRSVKLGNFTVRIIPMKLWIELNRDDLGETVYIPGVGEVAASELNNAEYGDPDHYYIVSYKNETLYGLVFFYEEPLILSVRNTTSNYTLKLVDNLTHSNVFLVFSRGDWKEVENRMSLVEGKTFLLKPSPSFGFGLGVYYPAEIMLLYSDIDIQGSDIIQKGYHTISITSNKTDEQNAVVVERE